MPSTEQSSPSRAENPDAQRSVEFRHALHAVAELLIAGPQYAATGDIRLTATADGFAGWAWRTTRVSGIDLTTPAGRFPLRGRLVDVAKSAGITPRPLRDVYSGGPDFSDLEPVDVAVVAVHLLLRAIINGDAALRSFAPNEDPILWPEHCDIGISVPEVNYGVSPGDSSIDEPHAYVGPWRVPSGPFWNQPFWAARPLSELPTPPDITSFFVEGRVALRGGQGGRRPKAQTSLTVIGQPNGDRAT